MNGAQPAEASMKPMRRPGNFSGIRFAIRSRNAKIGSARPCAKVWLRACSKYGSIHGAPEPV